MNRPFTTIALLAGLSLSSAVQATNLYGMGHDGINLAVLYQIDTETGTATKLGVTPDAYLFTGGLTYSSATDTLYSTGYDMTKPGAFGAYSPALYKINRTSGVGLLVGYLDPLNLGYMANGGGGLTWDSSSNTLYSTGCNRRAIPNGETCDSALYTIDTSNGQATPIGLTGIDGLHGGGLAFQSTTQQLFATGSHENDYYDSALYKINENNGAATFVGIMGAGLGLSYGGLDFDPTTGLLYATGWSTDQNISQLFRINTTTGAATPIGATLTGNGLAMGGLAFAPLPVPEPETYAMMLAGLGLVGAAARRRRG